MKLNILGWKHSKGEYEGRAYDHVTIYAVSRMEQKDTQRGAAGIDMRGDASLVDSLKKMDFGGVVLCEIGTEARATGKGQFVETVVSVTPVQK
ncbi:MAG: hypothetical protein WC504_01965 [Methylobacter sp.]